MLVSNVTALQTRNELTYWENRPFCGAWPQPQHRMPSGVTKAPRKKKRVRTSFTTQQLNVLEEIFSKAKYIDPQYRRELAQSLELGDKCIKVWFQNRRMKEKKDASDSCEFSSGNSTCDSSSSPHHFKEDTNCEMFIKPEEETSVTGDQANTKDFSDYQITFNQHLENQNDSETNSNYDDMYPTEYYPSYGSEYYSTISNQYLNQHSVYNAAANAGNGSWYADANNYFYCNN